MKKKQFVFLAVILLIMSGAFFAGNKPESNDSGLVTGSLLLRDTDTKVINKIKLSGSTEETSLVKSELGWKVDNRYSFNADPELVASFLENISQYKIFQIVENGSAALKEFGLDSSKNPNCFTVSFFDSTSKQLAEYRIGKDYKVSGKAVGRYIYIPSTDQVAIIDDSMGKVASAPRLWLKKFIPGVADLASVGGYQDGILAWQISRESAQKPFRIRYPIKMQETDLASVKQLMEYIRQYHYLDVISTAEPLKTHPTLLREHLIFQSFDGTQFKIDFLGIEKKQVRSRIEVSELSTEKKSIGWNEFELQQILSEYHFMSSAQIYAVLNYFKKQKNL